MDNIQENASFQQLIDAVIVSNFVLVVELLKIGVNVNGRDNTADGNSIIHYALMAGNLEIEKLLLDSGAFADEANHKGVRPVNVAVLMGKYDHVELLIQYGARVDLDLFSLVAENSRNIARAMCEKTDECKRSSAGFNILHLAIMYGDSEDIDIVLRRGLYVNETGLLRRQTPLHLAAKKLKIDAIRKLLNYEARVDFKDEFGYTALHAAVCAKAAKMGSTELQIRVVDILAGAGAAIEARTLDGSTPLHLVALSQNIECLKFLVQLGANVNVRDDAMHTPLLRLAVARKARCQIPEQVVIRAVNALLDSGANVNAYTKEKWTALYLFSFPPLPRLVEILLMRGADPNKIDNSGSTALHHSAKRCVYEDEVIENQVQVAQLLVDFGVNDNTENYKGQTALELAVRCGNRNFARFLIKQLFIAHCTDPMTISTCQKNLSIIKKDSEFSLYFMTCALEVERMVNEKIYGNIYLWIFLSREPRALIHYMRNSEVVNYFDGKTYREWLSFYSKSLENRYFLVKKLLAIMDHAALNLSRASKFTVDNNNIVFQKILNSLSVPDIINLNAAFKGYGN